MQAGDLWRAARSATSRAAEFSDCSSMQIRRRVRRTLSVQQRARETAGGVGKCESTSA